MFLSFESGVFGKESCYRLQKSFPEKKIYDQPFPKSVHLHKNREWILRDERATLEVL